MIMMRQDLFEANEDDLLMEIGKALLSDSADALPRSRQEIIELSRRWVDAQTINCRNILCGNRVIKELGGEGFSSQVVAAVAALLETAAFGTAATPLAFLLCRRGIL